MSLLSNLGTLIGAKIKSVKVNLDAEILRAKTAEDIIDTSVDTETSRATTAEGNLAANITSEATRATTAEGNLAADITGEATRATTAENLLATNITNETTARVVGDNSLQTNINTVAADRYTKSESDSRFVNTTGDTMTGNLTINNNNPSIYLKDSTDVGIDVALVSSGEGFYITEPEDTGGLQAPTGGKQWLKMADDAAGNIDILLHNGASATNRVFHEGYHPNADKLTTARTISLTGDTTGSVSFNGSSNVSIATVVANDSHTHDARYHTKSISDGRYMSSVNPSISGDLHVAGTFSSGNILTKRYIQIIAVERDSIIKDRINYVGDITLPFNCTVIELRAKTDSGSTLVTFERDSLPMTTINATANGDSTVVIQNPVAPKFSPIRFNTSASSGSGLTITITVQEEL